MSTFKISKRRWLILPVETKARELTAKTFLACVAAARGWGVVLGGTKGIVRKNQELLPRGTYLEKSVSPTRKNHCLRIKEVGNRVSAWCEEGLLYVNADAYRERRIDAECFDLIDYFFAWGEQQADDICSGLPRARNKIVLTGNPRFDLLRPELRGIFTRQAEELRRRFGKIILINTRFSAVNINKSDPDFDYVAHLKAIGKIKSAAQEAFWRRYVQLTGQVYPFFLELLPLLSREFSDHTIIVRPHPAENHAPWIEKSKDLPNVRVIFEGSVNEWLLAAKIMIHNNCMTGVEAFLLERPAISYRPVKDEAVEDALPDQVSLQASSAEELLALVRRFAGGSGSITAAERERQLQFAGRYLANLDGDLASEKIMDTLDTLDLPEKEAAFPLGRGKMPLRALLKYYAKEIKRRMKRSRYTSQKFPGLALHEMAEIMQDFRSVTGRFGDLEAVPVSRDTFCIFRP